MTLETIFYTLGTVFLALALITFVIVVATIIRIRSSIVSFRNSFAKKAFTMLKERNVEVASALGLTVAHFFMDRVKRAFDEKHKN